MNKNFYGEIKQFLNEIKNKFPERIKKIGEPLDDPVLTPYTNFFCFLADRDPTSSEPLVYQGYDGLIIFWVNESTEQIFISMNNLATPLAWDKIITQSILLSVLKTLGWNINTSRNYGASGVSLNSSRQPSTSVDTFVSASIKQVNVLLSTTTLTAEVSPDNSTWTTVNTLQDLSGVASDYTTPIGFTVPASYYYRLVSSGSGTISLVSCEELPM
jgi:hypothetical protein